MDVHSLMKKKLDGKYDQPKLAADDMAELDDMAKEDDMAKKNNMAKEKDNNIEDDKEGDPETDTNEDGQVTPPRSPHLDDAMLTSPPKTTTEKSKKARRMMATFKPRVQCGECDFVGKEGREMDSSLKIPNSATTRPPPASKSRHTLMLSASFKCFRLFFLSLAIFSM